MVMSFAPQGIAVAPNTDDSIKPFRPEIALTKESLFTGYPKLKQICSCESGLEQFVKGSTTTVLRGNQNPKDVGICQINEKYHKERSISLNYDINTMAGNVGYAKYLYNTEGAKPWVWSQACWDKPTTVATNSNK